jgi:5-methylcytosine-specific restriction endonuclease McrA
MGELNDVFERRWRTIEQRAIREKKSLPQKGQIFKLFLEAYYNPNGFKCDYCGVQLKIKDIPPYYFVWSLEHKQSLFSGGTNAIENLAVVCHRCNLTKGPMSEETWRQIIKFLPQDVFNNMCNELFAASMAKKLERQGLGRNDANE